MARNLPIEQYERELCRVLAEEVSDVAKVEVVRTMSPAEYTVTAEGGGVILLMLQEEIFGPWQPGGLYPRQLIWAALVGVRSLRATGAHGGAYALLDDIKAALSGKRVLSDETGTEEGSVVTMIHPQSSTFLAELNGVFWYSLTFTFTDLYTMNRRQP